MRHTFFALFDDRTSADETADDLHALPPAADGESDFHVIVHDTALDSENLAGGETRARAQALDSSLIGAAAGGVIGALILGPVGLAGPLLAAAVGSAGGALTGVIGGASVPDRRLEDLAAHRGPAQVILTIETRGLTQRDRAEDVARRHGARIERRAVF